MNLAQMPIKVRMKILEIESGNLKRSLKKAGAEAGFREQQMRIFAKDFQKFNNYDLLPKLSFKQELIGMLEFLQANLKQKSVEIFELTKKKLISYFRK